MINGESWQDMNLDKAGIFDLIKHYYPQVTMNDFEPRLWVSCDIPSCNGQTNRGIKTGLGVIDLCLTHRLDLTGLLGKYPAPKTKKVQ